MAHGPDPRHAHADHAADPGHEHAGDDHHGFATVATAVGRSERRRKLRVGLTVALLTVAGLTLCAELALRLSGQRARALEHNVTTRNRRWIALSRAGIFRPLDDPVRRYGLRPLATATIDAFEFKISAQGARGTDLATPKPAGEKRILCLGDSFAFGLWCDDDETVPAELARRANEAAAKRGSPGTWRSIDLGVPGYHLGQSLRTFEQEGGALEPDLVVLYFNTNDIEQSGFYYDEDLAILRRDFLPLPVALKETLWRASHLYGWIATRHARAAEAGSVPFLEPRVPWAHVRADNQAYTREALQALRDQCRTRDLPLFVIHQPLVSFLGAARRDDWPVLPLEAWFRGVCAELELPALHLCGWARGYADGIDRFDQGAPPDFLPDQYIADEEALRVMVAARASARAKGLDWDALPFAEQLQHFAGLTLQLPSDADFHLTGAGYRHVARLAFERLVAEGLLP